MSLDTWVDLSFDYGYCKSNKPACGCAYRCLVVSLMYLCFLDLCIDVNGGENDMKNILYVSMGEKYYEVCLSKIWLMKKIWNLYIFGIHGTRCFSSMLPSMPKGEIVNNKHWLMSMGEFVSIAVFWLWLCFVIDDNIVNYNRATNYDYAN